MDAQQMQSAVEQQLFRAIEQMEEQADEELARLDRPDEDEIERIRRERLDQMKKNQKQRQDFLDAGHGEYHWITSEREFFDKCKTSPSCIVHFARSGSEACNVLDRHLQSLCKKHIEAKFVRVDAEKVPFLVERLKVWMIPTIVVFRDQKGVDRVEGLDDLGGTLEFPTEGLAWRLGQKGGIRYTGDFDPASLTGKKKRVIRDNRIGARVDEDDIDWD